MKSPNICYVTGCLSNYINVTPQWTMNLSNLAMASQSKQSKFESNDTQKAEKFKFATDFTANE